MCHCNRRSLYSTHLGPHELPEGPDARHALGRARQVGRLPELVEVVALLGELEVAELSDEIGDVVLLGSYSLVS